MHHCLGEIDFNRSFESCGALCIHDFLVPDNVTQFHSFNFNPQIEFFVTLGVSEFSCRELPPGSAERILSERRFPQPRLVAVSYRRNRISG